MLLHLQLLIGPHVFVIRHVTNVMEHATEIYAGEGKTEAKSWGHKSINTLLVVLHNGVKNIHVRKA